MLWIGLGRNLTRAGLRRTRPYWGDGGLPDVSAVSSEPAESKLAGGAGVSQKHYVGIEAAAEDGQGFAVG